MKVRQRVKRNSNVAVGGHKSPMLEIEPYVVTLILQLAQMRVPITSAQGLQLCNSIIKDTEFYDKVMDHKTKYCRAAPPTLGIKYWRNFMKRNKHIVSAKKAVKFDTKRDEWCTYHNFKEMYEEVYTLLVSTGLAVKHDLPVWRNKDGEIVEQEVDSFGLESAYELIHPDWVVFVDEVGNNTSQMRDGNVGGQKLLCTKGGRPQQRAATNDAHFTVLGFTAATGEPIMCAIIFAAKSMKDEWRLGFDPFAEWIGEENDVEINIGEGKQMPMGPECNFKGKTIPCFCCCSESGSITGKLLKEMLEAIDNLSVFDRSTGLNPFLLLDGHGSRFELEFLKYIHTEETKWHCSIGVPYGTSYWQVGDSSEQNGKFKSKLYEEKMELAAKKGDHGQQIAIHKTDIVGLIRKGWNVSFADVESSKKAIHTRGWGPKALNYNVLLHPELVQNQHSNSTQLQKTTVQPDQLNLSAGLAGVLIDRVVIHKNREASLTGDGAIERQNKRKATAQQNIDSQNK